MIIQSKNFLAKDGVMRKRFPENFTTVDFLKYESIFAIYGAIRIFFTKDLQVRDLPKVASLLEKLSQCDIQVTFTNHNLDDKQTQILA